MFWQVLLLASVAAVDLGGVPSSTPIGVVTPLDYFDSGRQQVDLYLDKSDRLRRTADSLSQRCARVEVRRVHSANAYRSVLGSGVLLGDRHHLLTAGHMFDGYERGEIRVTFPSGEVLSGSLVAHRYEVFGDAMADWAIVALDGRAPATRDLQTTTLAPGGLVFVLGYPDHIGIDPRGKIVFGESSTRYLEPIVTLGTVNAGDPFTLDPRVGAVPTSGMSGGPVFDRQGRLAGILVSVLRESGAGSRYHYRIVPVMDVPQISGKTPPPMERRLAVGIVD